MILILYLLGVYSSRNYIVMFKNIKNVDRMTAKQILENHVVNSQSYFKQNDKILSYTSTGYLASLDSSTAKELEKDPTVEIVEEDKIMRITDIKIENILVKEEFFFQEKEKHRVMVQRNAPWGLSRINSVKDLKQHLFRYPYEAGNGVDVYVIDTGVMVSHPEFKGRARWGINLVENSPDKDENGHGTHCAGVIGGKNFGIAKKANIISVKVLDAEGSGLTSRIINGIDFVINEHEAKKDVLYDMAANKFLQDKQQNILEMLTNSSQRLRNRKNLNKQVSEFISNSELLPKTVINMSIGGDKSHALNFAIDYATSLGIHFSVAAGNDNENACNYSPGSSKNVITSGATGKDDVTADFSNYGSCVDIYAPGVDILSSWNDKGARLASGTSMAAPHTAGVMATYLSINSYTPKALKEKILGDAKREVSPKKKESNIFQEIWPISLFFKDDLLPLISLEYFITNYLAEQ